MSNTRQSTIPTEFYLYISSIFCLLVVLSNIISAKLFALPYFDSLTIPAGLLIYPFTFFLSDLTTEFFGAVRAKQMVYLAFFMTLLSYGIVELTIYLPSENAGNQRAIEEVFGLNGLRLFSSLTAYLIAQLVDIKIYTKIKNLTSGRKLWARTNGSTLVSQMIDTVVIDTIYLGWGLGIGFAELLPIMLFSYLYKACFSLIITPFYYLCVRLFQNRVIKRAITTPLEVI